MKTTFAALSSILLLSAAPALCAPGSRSARMEPLRVESRAQLGDGLASLTADGVPLDDHQLAALAVKAERILDPHDFSGLIELAPGEARIAGLERAHPEMSIEFRSVKLDDWRDGLSGAEIASAEGLARSLAGAAGIGERARLLRAFFEGDRRMGPGGVRMGSAPLGTASTLAVRDVSTAEPRREPPSPREAPSRIPSLDAARGLAILAMIPRNLAGIFMVSVPNPIWFTSMGAIVPALFLLINGFVIAYSTKKDNPFWYYALRGLRVALVSGLVLDGMVWHIVPMTWFDILTTVGLVIPIIYGVRKLSPRWQLAAAFAAFAIAFPLRYFFGYTMGLDENDLSLPYWQPFAWGASFFLGNEVLKRWVLKTDKSRFFAGGRIGAILTTAFLFLAPLIHAVLQPETLRELAHGMTLNHMFIDGWFPLFPWLGFAIVGSYLATKFVGFYKAHDRSEAEEKAASFFKRVLRVGLVAAALGVALWIYVTPEVVTRMGYTIPIFPPTWQYLISALGGVLTVVGGFYAMRHHPWVQKPYEFLQTMGRRSLEIYVLHEIIGQLFFLKLLGFPVPLTWPVFTGVALATMLACYVAAFLLEKYKFRPWL